jgi:hypothetical protein
MRLLFYSVLIVLAALLAHAAGWISLPENLTRFDGPRAAAQPTSAPAAVPRPTERPAVAAPATAPAAITPAPGDVVVQVDEATLTRQLNAVLSGVSVGDTPLGPATVRDVTAQLRGGQVVATGTAQIGPTSLPVSLTGRIDVSAGRPRAALIDARLSGVQLPEAMRRDVEALVQGQVDQLLAGQPLRVKAVSIADGRLTIVGTRA